MVPGAPKVVIEISGAAWSSDLARLSDDTRGALETDGQTGLLKGFDRDEPPRVIHCSLEGWRYLSTGETSTRM